MSGGKDDMLKLWDVDSGKELLTFTGHTNDVNSVALFHEPAQPSKLLAALSGSADATMKFWRIGRADHYIKFTQTLLPRGHDLLTRNSADPESLVSLGSWYAFRGVHGLAVELLEEARSKGASVSPLMLARCYWNRGQDSEARKEFERALHQNEVPAGYLKLCIAAVGASHPKPTVDRTARDGGSKD